MSAGARNRSWKCRIGRRRTSTKRETSKSSTIPGCLAPEMAGNWWGTLTVELSLSGEVMRVETLLVLLIWGERVERGGALPRTGWGWQSAQAGGSALSWRAVRRRGCTGGARLCSHSRWVVVGRKTMIVAGKERGIEQISFFSPKASALGYE